MSDVPLEPYIEKCGKGTAWIGSMIREQMRAYGDARAAEARRLALDVDKVQAFERNVRADERRKALLEAANRLRAEGWKNAAYELRALADEASPKSVSG